VPDKTQDRSMECVYLIRDNQTGLHKIGMTTDWDRRSRQLQVGVTTTKVQIVPCTNAKKWEKVLHAMFKHRRIPQSEWFRITAEEALPKMNWLAAKTNQRIIVGNWHQAEAGHYYRRRKSSYGNWYTETKSYAEIQIERARQLELAVTTSEKTQIQLARREPGFWPTKEDPSKIEWAEKDPTYTPINGWIFVVIGSVLLSILAQQPALLMIALAAIVFGFNRK